MKILHDVPLGLYSTMRLGGQADSLVHLTSKDELIEALDWAKKNNYKTLMIGKGSNIVWRDEGYPGLILVNDLIGYEVTSNNDSEYSIRFGAGEIWDSVVERAVNDGASGIEALSLIPGSAGATPVQNVGAYGQEIAETLVSVEVYDNISNSIITLTNTDCGFTYRKSIFNTSEKGRYFILYINLKLNKSRMNQPFYASLQSYLDQNNTTDYSPANIRRAVIAIRNEKLPDPAKIANCGSFFANPIVDQGAFDKIKENFPEIQSWMTDNNKYKLSAAWLIENAGLKDFHDPASGMATWAKQPLVLINENAKHTSDLLNFKKQIVDKVKDIFGVTLVQEPEMLP